jgi:O-antigen/teichoic acid export membrane protein
MGLLGGGLVLAFLPSTLTKAFSVDARLLEEAGKGFVAVAILLCIGTVGNILGSQLQAQDRFLELNASQFAMGLAFQLVPVAAAKIFSPTLETVIIAGCAARSLQTWMYVGFLMTSKHRMGPPRFSLEDGREMLRYGAWTSISNIISPIVVNLDRVLISYLAGPAAVGSYSVAYNLVMKALLIPGSLASALFPRLSQASSPSDLERNSRSAVLSLGILFCPMLLVGCAALDPFLSLWLHRFASRDAVNAGEILLFGIWFNGLALIPSVRLQATGRPDLVAKIHAAELLPFIALAWLLVKQFGIVGAASAWTIRVMADSILIFQMAGMLGILFRTLMAPCILIVGSVGIFIYLRPSHLMAAALICMAFVFWGLWARGALPAEMRGRIRRLSPLVARFI